MRIPFEIDGGAVVKPDADDGWEFSETSVVWIDDGDDEVDKDGGSVFCS